MASIERTAYPRFKPSLTAHELHTLYCPTDDERAFIATHARGDAQQLTLLTLLKGQQHLGYLPALAEVPEQIRVYLCQQLHLLPLISVHVDAEKTLYRYRHVIRTYLDIKPYEDGGNTVVETAVQYAASTMSDPADLINVAVEHLIQQRFELPAFRTLDRLVMHVRHEVHQALYTRITASLEAAERGRLEALLHLQDGRTDFNRIKDTPRQATLKHLRQWTTRLTWLEALLPTRPFLTDIAHTKVQQFAAEAAALDVGDMRDIHHQPRREQSAHMLPLSSPSPDPRRTRGDAPQAHAAHHHRSQKAPPRAARAASRIGRTDAGGLRQRDRGDDPHARR